MDDLVAFLNARLDEDERYLKSNSHHLWTQRPLREVEAKRALVAEWRDHELERGETASYTDGLADGLELVVKQFAAVYRDHPDYRPQWRVTTG
jgi:hypothetical protein